MWLKRHLPTREHLRDVKSLRFLGEKIFEPNLWHFNRHSVSYAVLIGSICCFLPIPFQMIPCIFLCIVIRCNVPLSVAIVWISNPITMPAMMFFAYRIGCWILGQDPAFQQISVSFQWLLNQLSIVWLPLILGALVSGFTMGITGFICVRLYWRWKISRYWKRRRARIKIRR